MRSSTHTTILVVYSESQDVTVQSEELTVKPTKTLLKPHEREALAEIKRRLDSIFPVRSYILFGSRARGDDRSDSDIDLLIVTERTLNMSERLRVNDIIFDINVAHDTLFSRSIVERREWTEGLTSLLPIHQEVEREGIPV